jgi:hypothetical protein
MNRRWAFFEKFYNNSDHLQQRRKGRKGRKITVKKFSKIIHLFPPNLACFAPWRESIPRVRVCQIPDKLREPRKLSSIIEDVPSA